MESRSNRPDAIVLVQPRSAPIQIGIVSARVVDPRLSPERGPGHRVAAWLELIAPQPPIAAVPFLQQLDGLSLLLRDHANLWRPQPFVELDAPWQADRPQLAAWLDALRDSALGDPSQAWLLQSPPWLLDLARILALASSLPEWVAQPLPMGADAARRIPGRKVLQIEHFCASVQPLMPPSGRELVATSQFCWCPNS